MFGLLPSAVWGGLNVLAAMAVRASAGSSERGKGQRVVRKYSQSDRHDPRELSMSKEEGEDEERRSM